MTLENIEFLTETDNVFVPPEDYIRYGVDLDEITVLSMIFKEAVTDIGKQFMTDEDNEIFVPLRKYYATALLIMLRDFNPQLDPTYTKIKQSQKLGLETVYLLESKIPELIMEVHKLFFLDTKNPHLYNFMDGGDDFSFTGMNKNYGYISIHSKIQDAISPSKKTDYESLMSDKTRDIFDSMFKTSWIEEYEERIGLVCNSFSIDLIERDKKTVSRLMDFMD